MTDSSSFTSYSQNKFDDECQIELSKSFKELSEKKVKVMLSNSDPRNSDENDNFFDELYKEFEIKRVYAKRMINCQAGKRGDITEIVVRN